MSKPSKPSFYEFFAGGGMARAGLGRAWNCLFANDLDPKKADAYVRNWGAAEFRLSDVARLKPADLPASANLAWASFPCQDLSLAGSGAGLGGERSGTFWPFWKLLKGLARQGREPGLIVIENVCGALTSHQSRDFAAIAEAIGAQGYRFGAMVIDAVHFTPQSRPRLFIVATHAPIAPELASAAPDTKWHSPALAAAYESLPARLRRSWVWWRLPLPPVRRTRFADLLEQSPQDVPWHTPAETRRLLELMSPINRRKVSDAQKTGRLTVGALYRRTRRDEEGNRVQRAEVRFDDVAGCLRTPAGGSSRQLLMLVQGRRIRSRLMSAREAARLMGLPERYQLPENYNQAYHLVGDGLVVPVIRHLSRHLLEPLTQAAHSQGREAA